MTISFRVTNQPPQICTDVSQPLLDLFQAFAGKDAVPFQHQSETFRVVMEDQNVFLVAGTAAGKTLAIAVPLFYKLQTRRVRKILLMYPTIALMEDQRRVMDRLAEITGLEVSQIQGGMSRSQLIAALNKPVILATPDAIYWFFHKNIKYSGLLIYALSLVDEFVLDEAHLFNGLMLRNFEHLWQRIQLLAKIVNKSPRFHILTATPTEALQRLNNGVRITGRSKCGDVSVGFKACGLFDRVDAIVSALDEALESGRNKVLVVCNSARVAHQLFERFKTDVGANTQLLMKHQLRFGKVEFGELLQWLEQVGVEHDILDGIRGRFFREEAIMLSDLPDGTTVILPLEDVICKVTEIMERQCWRIKQVLRKQKQHSGETCESLLQNQPLPCKIVAVLHERLKNLPDLESQQTLVDEWLTDTLERLSVIAEDRISCRAREFSNLQQALAAGLGRSLAKLVFKRLVHEIKVDPEWIDVTQRSLIHRPVYLRWLDWMVDKEHVERLRALVEAGLKSGALQADYRHIGLWEGMDVPVIVYSGSMAKNARSGLIDVFADLERAVLISTSAVEVGVDFAADMLITEECEGNGFLQRFGRVGRHGNDSRVLVLVSGDVAAQWRDLDGQSISREDFSARVLKTFPKRNYAATSTLLDADHYLVNEQLGRIGMRLNQTPELLAACPLAKQLRSAEIPVGFGLRSTMPQVTLKDGVTKDPFYLLRYVDDLDLRPAGSPFEVARANVWFTELIFQRARFNVMVDLRSTLEASRAWFLMKNNKLKINAQPGIGALYVLRMNNYYRQTGNWHHWLPENFILLHGDVYLQRAELGVDYSTAELVCDAELNPLFIPDQNYLVFLGWRDADEARRQISASPIADWEELYYDWDGVKFNNALVLLEHTAGACFAAYKEWLDYVDRCVQK